MLLVVVFLLPVAAVSSSAAAGAGAASDGTDEQHHEGNQGAGLLIKEEEEEDESFYSDRGVSYAQRILLRDEVREMQSHAWSSYLEHGYPGDELMPLSCKGRYWNRRTRGTLDDALGGYLLTVVDGADTLAVMAHAREFDEAVRIVAKEVSFERDVSVSVFEANIRVLGGLLSLHFLLTDARLRRRRGTLFFPKEDDDDDDALDTMARRMLDLATDLGERLLPAFETKTGIPAHKVNLLATHEKLSQKKKKKKKQGTPNNSLKNDDDDDDDDSSEESCPASSPKPGRRQQRARDSAAWHRTCSAAAGTFALEFGRLSRLTGDARFEQAARNAVHALWSRRSKKNLVATTVDAGTGEWLERHTGVGAGVDSFIEYLLKGAIYFDDDELQYAARLAVDAVANETRFRHRETGLEWNAVVDYESGEVRSLRVSALQAFWPSVLVMDGALDAAKTTFSAFWALWRRFRALPDLFDLPASRPVDFAKDSPLRPELAESALHLFLATSDPHYLVVGRELIYSLQNVSRVRCGFASVADASTHRLDDRMDSYFLAETLKYLFLLMDLSLHPKDQTSFFCTPNKRLCPRGAFFEEEEQEEDDDSVVYFDDDARTSDVASSSSARRGRRREQPGAPLSSPQETDGASTVLRSPAKKNATRRTPSSSEADACSTTRPGAQVELSALLATPDGENLLDDVRGGIVKEEEPPLSFFSRQRRKEPSDLPAACDPRRCLPMEDLIFTTEGHIFDLRHRGGRLDRDLFGAFGAKLPPRR